MEFDVVPSSGLASSIRICIDPPHGIKVKVPPSAVDRDIRAAVRQRARWISRFLAPQKAVVKRHVSGESILYLGRRYLLKVTSGKSEAAKLHGKALCVQASGRNPVRVRQLLEEWYRSHASEHFKKRIDALYSPSLDGGQEQPAFQLRAMRRQWGSCSPAGKLLLNPALIKAPRRCVDYVILHELCHRRHPNHGEKFYRHLKARMNDWEEHKAMLELVSHEVLI